MDSEDKFAVVMMLIVSVTIVAITFMCVSCTCNSATAATDDVASSSQDSPDVSPTIEHANGCPLDAVAYDAPAFANRGSKALKVVDRLSGDSWWLVKMGTEWVVLPIESKEASE